jgi:hypothetical protein
LTVIPIHTSDRATFKIELTQGLVAIVDEDVFGELDQYNWCAMRTRNAWYALRREWPSKKSVLMHRVIMNAPTGQRVDHINENGLDNRKCNLRFATHSQNIVHSSRVTGASRFKGVSPGWRPGKWRAEIKKDYVTYHLGTFNSEEEGALAYDKAAKELFGEFAATNY